MKNKLTEKLKAFSFLVLIIIIFWLIISGQKQQNSFDDLKEKYSTSLIINDSIEADLSRLRDTIKQKDIDLSVSDDKIKALDTLIMLAEQDDSPCEHKLNLHKEQVKELKTALTTCKESKQLETKVSKGLAQINVNNEIVLVECMNQIEIVEKKEKKRKVLQWVERGGWALLLVLALI